MPVVVWASANEADLKNHKLLRECSAPTFIFCYKQSSEIVFDLFFILLKDSIGQTGKSASKANERAQNTDS